MGPWGHAVNTTRTLGEADFGPDALIDLDGYVVAFLDEHAKGAAPGPPPAPFPKFDVNLGTGGNMLPRPKGSSPPTGCGIRLPACRGSS
jgi:hypothetical protein